MTHFNLYWLVTISCICPSTESVPVATQKIMLIEWRLLIECFFVPRGVGQSSMEACARESSSCETQARVLLTGVWRRLQGILA